AADISAIENERRGNETNREQRAEDLSIVIEQLASGLQAISSGDFNSQIATAFATEYEQLRSDFNIAVLKLQAAEDERVANERKQATVVTNLAAGLKALFDGQLTFEINESFAPEYEKLRTDFNGAISKLRDVVTTISYTAKGIRLGSTEISQSSDKLSQRTEHQAATLEETAAAMDEITATVKQTAEGAKEASQAASNARAEAKDSGEVVHQAVDAMGEIEKSSGQISQIIGVIDDIAFQTNLLALNAGVEAARAGDAGRGFAVVAQEVRALAQRSSDAAKEIKGLISASSQHVEKGVNLVGRAGQALQDIVLKVENVSNLVSEIAASAQEQSATLSEVNTAVNKMDQVTQQNASMVEQTTAACHSLTSDSDQLMGQVAHFNVGADRRGSGIDRRAARSAEHPSTANHVVETEVARQQNRVAALAATKSGSAALKAEKEIADEWEDF
ncbi:MAG: methyl-accepting chemotaxis protein, partial [Pseudomonadota bacterium]